MFITNFEAISDKMLKKRNKLPVFSCSLEQSVAAHVRPVVDCRGSEERPAGLLDMANHAGLGRYGRVVGNGEVPDDPDLPGENAVLSYLAGACNSGLGGHYGVVADDNVVRYLAEIVDLDAVADDGGLHFSAVYGGVRADFDIVADDYVSEVLDLLPCAVRLRCIAETVGSDDAVGVKDNVVSDNHAWINADSRIDYAVAADDGTVANADVVGYMAAVADSALRSDACVVSDIDLLADLGAERDVAEASAVSAMALFLVRNVFEESCDRAVCVGYTDHGRSNRLLWLKTLVDQQDACLAGIDVLFVFRVCEEAELTCLAMFDLGE